MCIVIDACALSHVFNAKDKRHKFYAPVLDWIEKKKGFVVFGGTTYKGELRKAYRYLRMIRNLKDAGKAVSISDKAVDEEEQRIADLTKSAGRRCNDRHIIALLSASRCNLLCTEDGKSHRYVKNTAFYCDRTKVHLYTSTTTRALLLKHGIQPDKLSNVE